MVVAAAAAAGIGFEIEGLEVTRGARTVLRVPSLSIAPGETLAIVGPNGAGKSTLLSILAGLEAPSRGQVRIGGNAAERLAARRRVALLPQDAPMLAGSVASNIAAPLALRGISRAESLSRASALLERMGLSPLAARQAAQLSGGEARRVALARALVTEPEALLLDEPFNGVDDPARELLVADILASVRLAQRTLILVTQRRDEALRLATRLVVMWNGELRQSGPMQDVLAHPVDPDVARFLGLENVLKGRVTANTADGVVLDVQGVTLHASVARPRPISGELWIVFSPEQVELRALHDASRGSARNLLPATVVSLLPREGRVEVSLDAGFPIVAAVTRAAVDELALAPGVRVRAVLKATALHLVPA